MDLQTINIGSYANDGTGDDLRSAFQKIKANFDTVSTSAITSGENLGIGTHIFAGVSELNAFQFNTIKNGDGISLSLVDGTITISTTGSFGQLSSNLDLNGNSITGTGNIDIEGSITNTGVSTAGDVHSTVWGIDVRELYLLMLILNGQDVDLGNFAVPAQGTIDLGSFSTPFVINYDFGTFDTVEYNFDFGTF
jgi:hypothetical protein